MSDTEKPRETLPDENMANEPEEPGAREPGKETLDPFDPARLRLGQNFAEDLGVRKELLSVPVRKPHKQDWVRTHPDEGYRIQTAVLELQEERETYLVEPGLWPDLAGEIIPKLLITTINRQGGLLLWPIRLPSEDGSIDNWNRVAAEAANMATTRWIRLSANMGIGTYDVFTAAVDLPEPTWPDLPFRKILETAFKGRHIDTLDHPVLRRLRGEL